MILEGYQNIPIKISDFKNTDILILLKPKSQEFGRKIETPPVIKKF